MIKVTVVVSRVKRIEILGYATLAVGIVLLVLTFYNAYLFLMGVLKIPVAGDLMAAFGETLAPLIEASIRAIYLGIMGWIGSILTRRGVQVITSPSGIAEAEIKPKVEMVKTFKPPTEPVKFTYPQPREEGK